MEKQPKNIFEQILFGLEATNLNVIAVSEEIASMWQDIKAIKAALYITDESEPNALGAENNGTVEGNNTQQL